MFYVGIDIGKRSHAVALLDNRGSVQAKPFTIANSKVGAERLLQRVEQVKPRQEAVVFGMEATGHYWLPLYSCLSDRGHQVIVLNPLQTNAYRRMHIRPVKNDKVDAVCIAEFLRLEPLVESALTSEVILNLRTLSRLRMEIGCFVG
ncbi:MAG: IS110 family transposase [Chloroflexota bacterium]